MINVLNKKLIAENIHNEYSLVDTLESIKAQYPTEYSFAVKHSSKMNNWITDSELNELCNAKYLHEEEVEKRAKTKAEQVIRIENEYVYATDVDRPTNRIRLNRRIHPVNETMTGAEFRALVDLVLDQPMLSVETRETWSGARYRLASSRLVELRNEVANG